MKCWLKFRRTTFCTFAPLTRFNVDIIGRRFGCRQLHRQCLTRMVNNLINNFGKAEIEHVVRQRTRCHERSLASSSLHAEIEKTRTFFLTSSLCSILCITSTLFLMSSLYSISCITRSFFSTSSLYSISCAVTKWHHWSLNPSSCNRVLPYGTCVYEPMIWYDLQICWGLLAESR